MTKLVERYQSEIEIILGGGLLLYIFSKVFS